MMDVVQGSDGSVSRAHQIRKQEDDRVRTLIRSDRESAYREAKRGYPGPTPQTRKKLVPHAVETLVDRGVIDQSQASMLDHVSRAYSVLTAGTGFRMSRWERVDGGRLPTSELPGEVRMVRHYARWWDCLKKASLERAMPIVVDVAVDGLSLNEIARRRSLDKRTVKRLMFEGLDCWAKAGRTGSRPRD